MQLQNSEISVELTGHFSILSGSSHIDVNQLNFRLVLTQAVLKFISLIVYLPSCNSKITFKVNVESPRKQIENTARSFRTIKTWPTNHETFSSYIHHISFLTH